jgi:hypothetical protein
MGLGGSKALRQLPFCPPENECRLNGLRGMMV